MASEAVVSRIEIKWWGRSRSRKFHVDIDNQRIINYNNDFYPGFNGWNKHNIETPITGSSIKLTLTDGVTDCWGYNVKLGIREIKIYGRYVEADTTSSMENILFSTFSDCLSHQATLIMLKFLATKIDPNHT